jgi:predicted molibdopterin-dependent oxidoreductase YjgC
MGAYATALPGGLDVNAANAADLAERYGFPVGDQPGITAEEMIEAGGRGEIDVLYSSGGNFLEVLPEPDVVDAALARVPLRVHQDVVLSSQMFTEPGEIVVLLPAATRYEQRGGGTETTTERRIAYSPEIPGPRPGEVRSEWEIFVDLAGRVAPARAEQCSFASGQEIRDEIASVVPVYSGVELLRTTGDAIQWGGTRLCEGGTFPTPDGRARFLAVAPSEVDVPAGSFMLSTRRGKQFNTMVHQQKDPLTGASRDALFMAPSDIDGLGLRDGDRVVIRSEQGEMHARLHASPLRPGNVQVFFPEGNVLLRAGRRDPASGVPDYNAVVTVEAAPR